MSDASSDEHLIARFDAGDSRAFDDVVQRYLTMIYRFVHRLVGDASDAEEITQDTFLRAWEHLHSFRRSESFKTWIFAIARNAAIDCLRRKKSIPLSSFDTDEGDNMIESTLRDPDPLPDELAARAEDGRFVEQLLACVPESQREVLLLHYVEHCTFDEIARIVGSTLNTVKSRHRRALLMLRERIQSDTKQCPPDAPKRM